MSFPSPGPGNLQTVGPRIQNQAVRRLSYPSPFFDLASTYLPKNVKDLFKFCEHYFLTNPLINAVIWKMAEYPVTDLVLDMEQEDLKKKWEVLFDRHLSLESFLISVGLDYFCFGNAYVTISYPFTKFIKCKDCGAEFNAEKVMDSWSFHNYKFKFKKCPECGARSSASSRDVYLTNVPKLRLIRWDPKRILVMHNKHTGHSYYFYLIPTAQNNDLQLGRKHIVVQTPTRFIQAAKKGKPLQFLGDAIYHLKRPIISGHSPGYGMPLMLPVLKDSFFLQLLKKSQECVSPDTLIETPSGLRRAEEVKAGDVVRTHLGRWREIEKKWAREAKTGEMGRTITVTGLRALPSLYSPMHPILAIRRNERHARKDTPVLARSTNIINKPDLYEEVLLPADQVLVGDYLLYPRSLPTSTTHVDVARLTGYTHTEEFVYSACTEGTALAYEAVCRGERVEPGNAGKVAKRLAVKGQTPKRFPAKIEMSEDLAYILGWYAGDGSCGARCVHFSLGLNDDHTTLSESCYRVFGSKCTCTERGNLKDVVLGNVFARALIKGMIPGRAKSKSVPLEVLNGPTKAKIAFLRGYWEADGYFGTANGSAPTVSRDLAYGIYRLLLHLGCIATVSTKTTPPSTLKSGRTIKGDCAYVVQVSTKSQDRMKALLYHEPKPPKVVSGKSGFFWGEWFASRVVSVEESDCLSYIDFKVQDDTTFCTPGVATKNCVALEHLVPLRVIFPQSASAQGNVVQNVQLTKWRNQIYSEISRWRRDCVSPDTLLETPEGLKRAVDVQEGDLIIDHAGAPSKVEKRWVRPLRKDEKAYKINAKGLRAVESIYSENHPIWTAKKYNKGNGHKIGNPEFIKVKDLQRGDYIGFPISRSVEHLSCVDISSRTDRCATDRFLYTDHESGSPIPCIYEYLEKHGVSPKRGDLLREKGWTPNQYKTALSALRQERVLRRVPKELPIDKELAWVVGVYLAEGSTTRKQVFFALHKSEKHIIRRLDAFFWDRFQARGFTHHVTENGVQRVYNSTVAAQFIKSLCPGLAKTKRVPQLLMSAPDDVVVALLEGMVEGDGHNYDKPEERKKLSYSTSSLQMAEDVRKLFLSLGVIAGISKTPGRGYHIQGRTGEASTNYKVQVYGSYCRLFWAKARGDKGPKEAPWSRIGLIRDGYIWHRIDSVEEANTDTVIGFSVASDTFCTWGVATHNSNYMPIMPYPVGFQAIGGDGKSLMLSQEIGVWSEQIIAGMGVPREFIFGGLSYCLDVNSWLQTSKGLIRLKELVPAEGSSPTDCEVPTHKGIQPVSLSHNTGLKKAARIKTSLGFESTPSWDHKYLVLNRDLSQSWKKASKLEAGDRVAVKTGANLWPAKAPDLTEAVTAAKMYAKETTKRELPHNQRAELPTTLTHELARLLGYLISEGSCADGRRHGFSIKDPEIMEDFVACVDKVFGYEPSTLDFGSGQLGTEIGRREAVGFLRALGLDGYSADKEIPACIRTAPKNYVCSFLKACFEGDRGVSTSNGKQVISYTSKSDELLSQIQMLLLNMGIVSSKYDPSAAKPCGVLQVRSEYVQHYADHVGFVSTSKKSSLNSRANTAPTHIGERIPYLKEALDGFRNEHFSGRGAWTYEALNVELTKDLYSSAELAELLDRDPSTIRYYVRKGKLIPDQTIRGEGGRFDYYVFSRHAVQAFLAEGRSVRRTVPGRDAWGMTYRKLSSADLTLIKEKDPALHSRITELAENQYVWDSVKEVELFEYEVPMGDLTVEEDHSFIADGIVCHNSGSNVSLRMLEVSFLSYRNQLMKLVDWITHHLSIYLNWGEPPKTRLRDFKMADDLQRKMYLMNLNQQGKVSDTTLLSESDLDRQKEDELMKTELNDRLEVLKKNQLATAEIQGEVGLTGARYQVKAQEEMANLQQEANARQMNKQQTKMEEAQEAALMGQSPLPMVRLNPELKHPQPALDIRKVPYQIAEQMQKMDPKKAQEWMQGLESNFPDLASLVKQVQETGGGGSLMKPLPEQLPPRRETSPI